MRTQRISSYLSAALLFLLIAFGAPGAQAKPLIYTVDLKATAIGAGETVFGFSSPPEDSFIGSLTLIADLMPNQVSAEATVSFVDFKIGTGSWTMSGTQLAFLWTDSAGEITSYDIRLWSEPAYNGSSLSIVKGGATNVDWYASDATVDKGQGCSFGPTGVLTGPCISGSPGSATIIATPVPEGASLHLLAGGLALLILRHTNLLSHRRRGCRRG
ncbi:hypothetical protein [Pelomonas sp. Root1444]|uniref:hypothetical protein n=1 Tax=Pelomonas sp. Root1444 TaxID=1736464 RepID=UPI000702CAFB|nr:hypothetical protein [Pelomonas sp. Root1444]KQY88503.1 hypothetical protein ASD35_13155 [Pelomonas sp. Root1444]